MGIEQTAAHPQLAGESAVRGPSEGQKTVIYVSDRAAGHSEKTPDSLLPGWAFVGVFAAAALTYLASRAMHWLQARREVYMEVMVGVSRAIRLVGSLANADAPFDEAVKEFNAVADIPAKAEIVCKPRLLSALVKLQAHVSLMMNEMFLFRMQMSGFQGSASANNDWKLKAGAAVDEVLQMMDRANLEGRTDKAEWDRMKSGFARHSGARDAAAKAEAENRQDVLKIVMDASRSNTKREREAIPLIAEVLAAARAELGFFMYREFDKTAYIAAMLEAADASEETMEQFFSGLGKDQKQDP